MPELPHCRQIFRSAREALSLTTFLQILNAGSALKVTHTKVETLLGWGGNPKERFAFVYSCLS